MVLIAKSMLLKVYFLVKETYIDVLQSTNKDGNEINSEHIIMKGIPTSCIKYYAEQHNISVLDVYKQLYNNEVIKFDLTNDGNKLVCKNNKDYTVSNVTDFTRKCQYIRDENDKNNLLIEFYFVDYI